VAGALVMRGVMILRLGVELIEHFSW